MPSASHSRGDAHSSGGWGTAEAEVLMRSWGRLSRASCIRRRARWKASATQRGQQATMNETAPGKGRDVSFQ